MAEQTVSLPTFTDRVEQQFFLTPLNGPLHPENYLDRFPDEVYSKGPDSHLVRFMYSLLGPAGIGWLKKNYLDTRLLLADHGVELFDLERYYGNPFRFGRILAERYDDDPLGLLPREAWDKIKARDEQYRSRAIDYFNAARHGTTPEGMRLVARSGTNHEVEIIENYKYLFDIHSDEPKGFAYFGTTRSTSEFIVVPRLEVSRSEVQVVTITGTPTGGNFVLGFEGRATATLPFYTSSVTMQATLEALPNIGSDNVRVTGGPARDSLLTVTNLVTNPSVETNATGYEQISATGSFVRSTTRAYKGSYSLKQTNPGTNAFEGFRIASANRPAVTASTTYTAHVAIFIESGAGNELRAALREYDSGGSLVGSTGVNPVRTTFGSWQILTVTRTMTAAAVTCDVVVFDEGTHASVFYVDAIAVAQTGSAFTYGDGDSPEWTWSGTAHASTSTGPVGTLIFQPYRVYFTGKLAGQDVPELKVLSNGLSGGVNPTVTVTTERSGVESSDETVEIKPELRHNLQTALDFLRPVNSIPSTAAGKGLRSTQPWKAATASSEYNEVLRFVIGNRQVSWPTTDRVHWIEEGVEKQAPRIHNDRQHHYVGFHEVQAVSAYTDAALGNPNYASDTSVLSQYASVHIGRFSPDQARLVPFLQTITDDSLVHAVDRVLADYAEPLTVATQVGSTSLINGIYPADYATLPGVPPIKYHDEQFWASRERTGGAEILELDLGSAKAVNFLSLEVTRKPFEIEVAFDTLDLAPHRNFIPVTPGDDFPESIFYELDVTNPWATLEFDFTDALGRTPFTRFIRITFTRRVTLQTDGSGFLYDQATATQKPFSVEVRNLRLGRNSV